LAQGTTAIIILHGLRAEIGLLVLDGYRLDGRTVLAPLIGKGVNGRTNERDGISPPVHTADDLAIRRPDPTVVLLKHGMLDTGLILIDKPPE
jgi:hypothetical protein